MRIVVDLQGAQTPSSRNRGIGRYTMALVKALLPIAHAAGHEVLIACNNAFPASIPALRREFAPLLPADRFLVWDGVGRGTTDSAAGLWATSAGERLREDFLLSLRPDVVFISSLFEGPPAIVTAPLHERAYATAVILYDLIPLVFDHVYLGDANTRRLYFSRLGRLERTDLMLAISEASRQDGIRHLGLPPETIVNIAGAVDDIFRPREVDEAEARALRDRYRLKPGFIMYTGGIGDFRKNTDGLLHAYARLPKAFRREHPLAIVCSVTAANRDNLYAAAREMGIAEDELVATGFVPDEDLVLLYTICALFVFPSIYEGFGLPVLEAMSCGAPTISSANSSIVEINDLPSASFDALDPASVADAILAAFETPGRLDELRAYALRRAADFSWDRCAETSLEAVERLHARFSRRQGPPRRRRHLAMVAPLPPLASGIADHTAALVAVLARDYDIDLVVHQEQVGDDWLLANCRVIDWQSFEALAGHYDQIVFHMGNSRFHRHMVSMIEQHGGIIVLHDFFLSGMLRDGEYFSDDKRMWNRALLYAHGYPALAARTADEMAAMASYPSNLGILEHADGIITHSTGARSLFERFYGKAPGAGLWDVVPLYRRFPLRHDRAASRRRLELDEQDFMVCSFGIIFYPKRSLDIVEAWLASDLAADGRCRLVLVGEHDNEYGVAIKERIARDPHGHRVILTGYISAQAYEDYAAAADAAVQLRAESRGETSISVLDNLAFAIPTVINAHGTMAEFDREAVLMLPDMFRQDELVEALTWLYRHPEERRALGRRGQDYLASRHGAEAVRAAYRQALDRFADSPGARRRRLTREIGAIPPGPPGDMGVLADAASALARNQDPRPGAPLIFVDVTALAGQAIPTRARVALESCLVALIEDQGLGWRVRPVQFDPAEGIYRNAVRFTTGLLRIPGYDLPDDPVDLRRHDRLLLIDDPSHPLHARPDPFLALRNRGIDMALILDGARDTLTGARAQALIDLAPRLVIERGTTVLGDQERAALHDLLGAGVVLATLDPAAPGGTLPALLEPSPEAA